MVRGRKPGKAYRHTEKFEELYTHPRESYRKISKALYRLQPTCVTMIAEDVGLTRQTVRNAVKAFRDMGLIYITHWASTKGSAKLPFYRVGDRPDSIRKTDKHYYYEKPKKQTVVKKIQVWEEPTVNWGELSRALAPRRNEEEVHEINRLYLNWISEGTYG